MDSKNQDPAAGTVSQVAPTDLRGFQRSWRESRDTQIAELERHTGRSFPELQRSFAAMKRRVIDNWPQELARFTEMAEAAGAVVTRHTTAEEAAGHVSDLCREREASLVVKGKSMVSEEIHLNDSLRQAGISAVETDLGEWLIQMAGDRPSHIVMPAIHKRKQEIAALLQDLLGRPFDSDDIDSMVEAVRGELRDHLLGAPVGLTGANALITESGSIVLVCNEGNNRMTVSLPPLHIVTAGIERLVPTFADAIAQIRLLARSATGQDITSYTSFLTGPRPGGEQHILLIDNGRTAMGADPEFKDALGCMRCGACANVCPPYAVVTGHRFGHIYTGAIGLVNTKFHHTLGDIADAQSLCVSCGACATVCPSGIPLPQQILAVRRDVAEQQGLGLGRRAALRLLASRWMVGAAARAAAIASAPLRRDGFTRLPGLKRHTSWRTLPALPLRPARSRLRRLPARTPVAQTEASGRTVLLLLQCLTDRLAPQIALSAATLLQAAGARVVVPGAQHCCGLPAYDSGDWGTARKLARATLDAFDGVDHIVTPASSCHVMITHDYERLFSDEPALVERAARVADRTFDLVDYLAGPARLPTGALDDGDRDPVTVHRFCQTQHVLGATNTMEELIRDLCRVPVRPLPEVETCCGFGGSTSLSAPDVAARILERKLDNVDTTDVSIAVTNNPGCALHLRGGAHASGRPLQVLHLAEYLARRLPPDGDGGGAGRS